MHSFERNILRVFFSLVVLEGLVSVWLLLRISTDPTNVWILGYSRARLMMALGMVVGVLCLLILTIKSIRDSVWFEKFVQHINRVLSPSFFWLSVAPLMLFICVVGYLYLTMPQDRAADLMGVAYHQRFAPLVLWISVTCAQAILVFLVLRNGLVWRCWCELFLLLLLGLGIWLPRVLALDRYVTVDEPTWITRSANFLFALDRRDYASTYQREHPGVTTMWVGATGFLWRFQELGLLDKFLEFRESDNERINVRRLERVLRQNKRNVLEPLVATRFIMVLGNTAILFIGFLYARRLVGPMGAWIGFALIAFDPFLVAHARLMHVDGLLSSLMFLSMLSFLSFSLSGRLFDLILSGIAAGLSWLTKSPGFFLIPVVGLWAIARIWKIQRSGRAPLLIYRLWLHIWPIMAWVVVATAIFVILWPAMWVDPFGTVKSIFTSAQDYAVEGHKNPVFFKGLVTGEDGLERALVFFYPVSYLWRSTPIVLVGLLAAIFTFVAKSSPNEKQKTAQITLGLALFVVVFTLLMNLGSKKFDRYLLPVFPSLDLISGLGWAAAVGWLSRNREAAGRWVWSIAIFVIVFGGQMISTMQTYPYYLSYYNPLMGGGRKAPQVMMIGWGEGLDQAASYLNQKPDADQLTVVSWYRNGCFSYFYAGDSLPIYPDPEENQLELLKMSEADYVVTYINQWQRPTNPELLDFLAQQQPEHTIWIDGLEYVRIYDVRPDDVEDAPSTEAG